MNRRLIVLVLVMSSLLAWFMLVPCGSQAQGDIKVVVNEAQAAFPGSLTFHLEAKSAAPITKIELEYASERTSCGLVSSKALPEFTSEAQVTTSWTWELKKTGPIPPGARIWWRWIVADEAGARRETPRSWVVFEDSRYEWRTLTENKVTLLWHEGDQAFGEELMNIVQTALERLASDTGAHLESEVKIYVYSEARELRGAVLFAQEWTGGMAIPDFGIILLTASPEGDADWIHRVTPHELAHLVTHQMTFNCAGDIPRWLDEGLAMYAEGSQSPTNQRLLEQAIAEDDLISLRTLNSTFSAHSQEAHLSYAQSYSVVAFLIDEYGRDKMQELLEVFRQGSGYDEALEEVYGFDTDGLEEAWRARVGAKPRARPTEAAPTALPTPLPTIAPWEAEPTALPTVPGPTATIRATPTPFPSPTPTPVVMPTPTPEGFYNNQTLGFSIEYPPDWRLERVEGASTVRIISVREEVAVWVGSDALPEATSLEEYASLYRLDFEQGWDQVEILGHGPIALRDSTPARELLLTAIAQNPVKLRGVFAVWGGRGYFALALGSPEDFDSYAEVIEEILLSLHLEEPKPFGISRGHALFLAGEEPLTLDPATTLKGIDEFIGHVFNGLVTINIELQIVPDLAERWDISEDGRTYTFYLRPGVRFHDGRELTAEDVKYSWERAAAPATGSITAESYLTDIVGVREKLDGKADEIAGVKVIDPYTLQVTIDAPKVYFLAKLATPVAMVVDRNNVESGPDWDRHPNGTGPFRLKEWEQGELLILERHEQYHQGRAELEHLVYLLYAGVPIRMYENGESDIAEVYLSDIERVLDPNNPLNAELLTSSESCTMSAVYDVTLAPFDDVNVRRAFNHAIDKERLIEVAFKDFVREANSVFPPGYPGYSGEFDIFPYDPARAEGLIAASKYGSVDHFPPVVLTTAGAGGGLSPAVAEMLRMWRENLGVEVQVEQMDPETYIDEVHDRHGQITFIGWCAEYPDPENFLDVLFHSKSKENLGHYHNPQVDELLEKGRVERDIQARLALYRQAEETIVSEAASLLIYHPDKYVLVKPYVHGFVLLPIGIPFNKEIFVEAR